MIWLHENIRFSKTHSEYYEQPYPLEETAIVFLDPTKKMHVIFVGYLWNIQGIFLCSIFLEHYFGNIPLNFIGNFLRIFREYIMGMFHEYSTNMYLPGRETFMSWNKCVAWAVPLVSYELLKIDKSVSFYHQKWAYGNSTWNCNSASSSYQITIKFQFAWLTWI